MGPPEFSPGRQSVITPDTKPPKRLPPVGFGSTGNQMTQLESALSTAVAARNIGAIEWVLNQEAFREYMERTGESKYICQVRRQCDGWKQTERQIRAAMSSMQADAIAQAVKDALKQGLPEEHALLRQAQRRLNFAGSVTGNLPPENFLWQTANAAARARAAVQAEKAAKAAKETGKYGCKRDGDGDGDVGPARGARKAPLLGRMRRGHRWLQVRDSPPLPLPLPPPASPAAH